MASELWASRLFCILSYGSDTICGCGSQALAKCVECGFAALLVGPSGAGKSALVHTLAGLAGHPLAVFPVGAATDALELLGNFEQVRLCQL